MVILSWVACTATGLHVLMGDFGTQRHIFTPIQQYLIPKIDESFGITMAEINAKMLEKRNAPLPADAGAQKKPLLVQANPASPPPKAV